MERLKERGFMSWAVCFFMLFNAIMSPISAAWAEDHGDRSRDRDHHRIRTTTPIRHVIIVIGENRSFDNLFATYQPREGQSVMNLLSEGIVNEKGMPGSNFDTARQLTAQDSDTYHLKPLLTAPYMVLPVPNTTYAPSVPWAVANPGLFPDPGLESGQEHLLQTGGTGESNNVPDTRFPGGLPNGPFQITQYVPYDSYTGDPVHRFFQMWQQSHCAVSSISSSNASGCAHNLSTWVAVQTGIGGNGTPPPSPFTDESTNQGAVQMGFYNMSTGDVPYFKWLADHFALSDNYHQAIMGGTGANHIALGTGDADWYSDGNGNPQTPPALEIENPNPLKGTDDWYTQDGYKGGSYVNCSDSSQPGVLPIVSYLDGLPDSPVSRCQLDHFYLLNNYNPGYHRDGSLYASGFYIPPSSVKTIGDELSAYRISWAYYGEGFHAGTPRTPYYCNICNPFQYATSIMTTSLRKNIQGLTDFYKSINDRKLPSVSIVKPDGLLDGHPASGKADLFEGFVKKVVDTVHHSKYWGDTAIFVTVDEGGGYYDSGTIQPLDFFGDGPRVPLLVISPFSRGGRVVHAYYDHVSLIKFIERNWGLPTLTRRSRDNFPNPVTREENPYVPVNGPAIGDLMEMFHFPDEHHDAGDNERSH